MADWTRPFEASYSWARVARRSFDPSADRYGIGTEVEAIANITDGTLEFNDSTATYESGTVECVGPLDVGSDLIRCYLRATFDDGTSESVALGTFNVSVPSRDVLGSYERCSATLDGRLSEIEQDAFETPLVIPKGNNGWYYASRILTNANLTIGSPTTYPGLASAVPSTMAFGLGLEGEDNESKLAAYNAIMTQALHGRAAKTDGYGRVMLLQPIDYGSTPVWTFEEGVNATFLSEATDEFDATGVANVVMAVYETPDGSVVGTAEDNDPASPWSIPTYGRRKAAVYTYSAEATQADADAMAARLLEQNRSVVRRVTIQHVWCGARVGDVVELIYPSAGISGRFAIRTQTVEVGSAGCLTTSELRRFERA